MTNKWMKYVYRLTHKETKQFYIGYRERNTIDPEIDILQYQSSSNKVRSMGFDNFDIEIIALFKEGNDAYDFENEMIKEYFDDPLCLNAHYRIGKSGKRFKVTDDARAKISKSRLGKKLSDEQLEEFRKSFTPERADKIAKARLGTKASEETKKRMSESQKKWVRTEEMNKRVSEAKMGISTITDDGRKRISESVARRIRCPHCEKDGNISNMKRWHFDNCKEKK